MSWWRANRLWLPAVPLALVALVAASSYHLETFWWDRGLHHAIASAAPGEPVTATYPYVDAVGPSSRTFSVRLAGVETAEEIPTKDIDAEDGLREPPTGTKAVVVHLEWKADPDETLVYCLITLQDEEGRRYEIPEDAAVQGDLCTPEGHEGPSLPLAEGQDRGVVEEGHDRPPSWTTDPVFLVPDDATITRALVWWGQPDYVDLPVP